MICFGFLICFSHSGFPTQDSHTNFSASNKFDAGKNPTRFFVFSCRMPSRALAFGRKDGMDRRSRSWILIAERFTVTQGIRERSSGRFEDKDTGTVSAVRAEASAHGRRTRMGVTRGVGYADHHNRFAVVMSPPLMPFLFSGLSFGIYMANHPEQPIVTAFFAVTTARFSCRNFVLSCDNQSQPAARPL